MESFWGVLKNEHIHHCRYATRQEAIQDITGYIEIFYNRQRRQARLGFLSPAAFARWFYARRLAGEKGGCQLLTTALRRRKSTMAPVEAEIDQQGNVRLFEPIHLP